MRAAAFFDLDKTLIARSSALAFARPLYRARLLRRRDLTRSAAAQLRFVSGRAGHDLMEALRTQMSATITGWSAVELRAVITQHLEPVLTPLVYAEALELVTLHQAAGRHLVLVTTNGTDMADPVGLLLGFDRVLSTQMVEADGRYTGEIADYMYGERKAAAIVELAAREQIDLAASYAYSDSITDLPMLRAVGHPHAVNPDHALRATATELGWPVLDFVHAPVLEPGRRHQIIAYGGLGLITALALLLASRRLVGRHPARRPRKVSR